jgi:hypothetical protein
VLLRPLGRFALPGVLSLLVVSFSAFKPRHGIRTFTLPCLCSTSERPRRSCCCWRLRRKPAVQKLRVRSDDRAIAERWDTAFSSFRIQARSHAPLPDTRWARWLRLSMFSADVTAERTETAG